MASLKSNFLVAVTLLLRTVVCQTDSVDYCVALGEVLQICEQETPGFTDMAATQQASCACGNSIGTIPWGPATFDSLAASCAVQYATIDTDIASGASQLTDFCTDYDVQATTSTTSSATVRTTNAVTSTQASGFASSTKSSNTGLITTPATTSSAPTTVISIVSASTGLPQSGAAAKVHGQFDMFGWALPIGGLLLGGL